jgi:Tfp pilus assembly protein PilF
VGQFRANLAVVQLRLGQKEAGWRNLEEAGRRAGRQPGVFILRAQEYFKSGRYGEAVRDYEWVLQMSPENARARRNLEVAKDMLERSRSRRK